MSPAPKTTRTRIRGGGWSARAPSRLHTHNPFDLEQEDNRLGFRTTLAGRMKR